MVLTVSSPMYHLHKACW